MNNLLKYKKILITVAFPYSNGNLHLGHILESIQADIFSRYNKFIGNIVYFISADDTHGTPIMLKSNDTKIPVNKLIRFFYKNHKKDFKKYSIKYDFYGHTNNNYNYRFLIKIFNIIKKKKLIYIKKINQFYDIKNKMFLPDRMVIGNCPRCKTEKQYGDNCNKCNYVYDATKLLNPISTLSNEIPILKSSKHIFLNFKGYNKKIYKIIKNLNLEISIYKKCKEWLNLELKSWNISRDYPYFGFKIPNSDKYFYVWLDATISYISTCKKLCLIKNEKYNVFWNKNSNIDFYQFIGKDIIYFHVLFWPYILDFINFRKPNKIIVHGHLTINNKKMSKSSKNFINARKIVKYIKSDYLRYYFASKLSNKVIDINFNIEELVYKINNNLINKILNLASRNYKLIYKYCDNKLSNKNILNKYPYNLFLNINYIIWHLYEKFKYNIIIKLVEKLSNIANKYMSDREPWKLNNKKKIREITSMGLNLFKIIIIYIGPITPEILKFSEYFLNIKLNKNNLYKLFSENHKINKFDKNKFKKLDINFLKENL